eukprot:symbB.v1.2.000208.t1/scaffold21.1/size436794/27
MKIPVILQVVLPSKRRRSEEAMQIEGGDVEVAMNDAEESEEEEEKGSNLIKVKGKMVKSQGKAKAKKAKAKA